MGNLREIDEATSIITKLNFKSGIDKIEPVDLLEALKQGKKDYYKKLAESGEPVTIRFTGLRRGEKEKRKPDELFVFFETLELVYPLRKVPFSGRTEATELLDKEYVVYIKEVDEEAGRVYLTDRIYETRSAAVAAINEKLEAGEEIYLRGRILGLQRNGGKGSSMMAAYVDIESLGVIGVVPIKQWSVGYSATESFRQIIRDNVGSVINFRVTGISKVHYGTRKKPAFICSRKDYLEKIGYDPWKLAEKTLAQGSTVKVKIVEAGKSPDTFFCALDGIFDLNLLGYVDARSDLKISDVEVGRYYYGFIQRANFENRFLRARLTKRAECGSVIKEGGLQP